MTGALVVTLILGIGCWIAGAIWLGKVRHEAAVARASRMRRFRILLPRRDSERDVQRATEKDFKERLALMEQVYSVFHGLYRPGFAAWRDGQEVLGFEMRGIDAAGEENGTEIGFYATVEESRVELLRKQITAFYEDAVVTEDETDIVAGTAASTGAALRLRSRQVFPIRTYTSMGSDPLNELASVLSHLSEGTKAAIQILVRPIGNAWMDDARHQSALILENKAPMFENKTLNFIAESLLSVSKKSDAPPPPVTELQQLKAKAIAEKAKKLGFETIVRVVITGAEQGSVDLELQNALTAFSQYDDPTLNGLAVVSRGASVVEAYRRSLYEGSKPSVLNVEELSTLIHLPTARYNPNPQILWMSGRIIAAPSGVATGGIRLGWNNFRGEKKTIYLNDKDRFRHLYCIGQTGMGKTQFLKVMAKQDIAAGRGLCVVDPHGDLIDELLQWVPKERAEDVILFDPADTSRPMGLNLFEASTAEERDFITNDALKIMIGLFGEEVFSARLQDYFRNAALTLMEDTDEPGTITDVVRLFTDEAWQRSKVAKVTNPIVKEWWDHTYASMGDREKQEMIPFWAAKFGQFITNSLIRNIIGQPRSGFSVSEAMDTKKIVLVKLSKGLIGDLNATLLGMILVNKIQVAAMNRAKIADASNRVPFFLYVDEFQNFVTDAFESILSEARKYKLGLIIAHQYIAQLTKGQNDKVKNAVFGNVGSMVAFKVGAADAEYLVKEFAPNFTEQDLVNQEGFTAAAKLSNNNIISAPFTLTTEKDFATGDLKAAEAISVFSKLRYARPFEAVNREILARVGSTTLKAVNAPVS